MAAAFKCEFDSFVLLVNETGSFPYAVTSATGASWLEGGSLAIYSGGTMLSPGAGLVPGAPASGSGLDPALGSYTYLSVPWLVGNAATVWANFTCFRPFGLAGFTLSFPDGLPLGPSLAGPAPRTQFPTFSAGPGTALRSQAMGFVEWAGEMDSYGNTHGVGLHSYSGGRSSGPLLLFNRTALVPGASKPQALVLGPGGGPGTHVAHQILGLVPAPGGAPAAGGGCVALPHTDKLGGGNAPGSGSGL